MRNIYLYVSYLVTWATYKLNYPNIKFPDKNMTAGWSIKGLESVNPWASIKGKPFLERNKTKVISADLLDFYFDCEDTYIKIYKKKMGNIKLVKKRVW